MEDPTGNVIWWTGYCNDESYFFYDAFWNNSITLDTSNPDLTNCFQRTVMTWIPCGFLWLASLIYSQFLIRRQTIHTWYQISKHTLLKIIIIVLLIILSLFDFVYTVTKATTQATDVAVHAEALPVDFVWSGLRIITFLLSLVLTHVTFRKGVHSSSVLFLFWFLQLIVDIVTLRSRILQTQQDLMFNAFPFVTSYIQFGLVLVEWITCLFSDVAAIKSEDDDETTEKTPLLVANLMESSKTVHAERKPCPKLTASFLSVVFFGWFTPTVFRGYRKPLQYEKDIWDIRDEDSSATIVTKFLSEWDKELKKIEKPREYPDDYKVNGPSSNIYKYESLKPDDQEIRTEVAKPAKKKKEPSLWLAFIRTFGLYYACGSVFLLFQNVVVFVNPQLLNAMIAWIDNPDTYMWQGYFLGVTMFVVSVLGVICMHHNFNISYTTGMHIRTALTSAIYRKAIRLSSAARKKMTIGEIVNLMSVDTQKLQDTPLVLNYIWSAPLMVAVAMYFLWQILGPSSMAGLALLLVILPFNSTLLARKIRSLQKEQMKLKDSRLKLMNQIISGIKVLKLYAWEPHFEEKITEIRQKELLVLRQSAVLNAATYILWFSAPFLVAVACFAAYVLSSEKNILDAQKAFVSMSLIIVLSFPLTILPMAIMFIVQCTVSIRRIYDFMLNPEIDPGNVQHDYSIDGAISIQDGNFTWGEEGRITLKNINATIKEGSLVAVVGQVGSGKSSLISAILGEMEKHSGVVNVKGDVAYVPQQAWIQNMSLRDNILFARPYRKDRYDKIVEACALEPDLKILPGGDMTEIGERGINVSGGQKQRISLARSVFQDADIYLLDDPLSAVDAHVGKHIFKYVVGPEGLLKRKTRVLVTHGITYLAKVDAIIVMKDGEISEIGTYDELIDHQGAFADFINTFLCETDDTSSVDEEELEQRRTLQKKIGILSGDEHSSTSEKGSQVSGRPRSRKRSHISTKTKSVQSDAKERMDNMKRKDLIIQETAEEGAIKLSVVKTYVRAATFTYAVLAVIALMCFVASQCGTNIWLSMWSNDQPINGTQDTELTNLRLGVYGGLAGLQTLSVFGLAVSIAFGAVSASAKLHRGLLSNILKCKMSFFETTPLGRIVNRFSKDIDVIDVNLPQFTQNLMTTFAPLISTLIVITYSTPIFITVVIPLGIFFGILQRVYVACARQIKRIDAVKRSPIYAFFSETLNGVPSIRAYKQNNRFIQHSDQLLDDSQKVWFEAYTSNRWVGIWAEFVGDIAVLFAAIFAVLNRDTMNPGLVGLSLSFALQVSFNLVMSVRSSCELETYIIAVERVQEYTEYPTEAPWEIPDERPVRGWPTNGVVEFKNYSTRYRAGLELVLKNITCSINSTEKIGIVGRTGAGKSSMTLALFRIIEADGGAIEIDNKILSRMGLHDVRNKLTIIPQDPVMFSGPLRFNLDPSNTYSDEEIWTALEHAHLKNFIQTLPDTLQYDCGEDGENLSVGQRQLVCLARALLRKSKVLVLDEATAAVDLETDDLIQTTIRSEFKDSTVLTIAHRLNTIMDYDRVIVMDGGEITEFDRPAKLLADKESQFHKMAKDAGLV